MLSQDDFQILAQSWTWQKTLDGLLAPNNEHAMPLGRLLTFAVVELAGRPTVLPFAGVLTGVVGLFLAMALACVFVRRELGHPFYGLIALVLFGVSSVYQQAVYWFAACFSVYALVGLLLALLAAQQYRRTGQWGWLLACVACCALAPCWFATGVLAGPFCCLYLLPSSGSRQGDKETRRQGDKETRRQGDEETRRQGDEETRRQGDEETRRQGDKETRVGFSFRRFIPSPCLLVSLSPCLAPLLGTAAFLAVVLPFTLPTILHLEHYESRHLTALEAFHPLTGAWNTVRSLVDNLALGVVGVSDVTVGGILAPLLLALLIAAGVWWARRSPQRRLALLGAGLILGSYLLIYSGRAIVDYDATSAVPLWPTISDRGLFTPTWSRYHLQPQLGLVLLFCGGLPAWEGRWFRLDATGRLTGGQTRALAWLLVVCFVIQAPRGASATIPPTRARPRRFAGLNG